LDKIKIGNQILINTTIDNRNYSPDVTSLTNGNFVVVWQSIKTGNVIFAQILDKSGKKINEVFQVNQNSSRSPTSPAIDKLLDGKFVVVWESTTTNIRRGIYACIYNPDGTINKNEFQIEPTSDYKVFQNSPNVCGISTGGFVVTWSQRTESAIVNVNMYGKVFDSQGNSINKFKLGTNTYSVSKIGITNFPDWGFGIFGRWVGWYHNDAIEGQIFDNYGNVKSQSFKVPTNAGNNLYPSALNLSNGDFLISWTSSQDNQSDIYAQIYSFGKQPDIDILEPDSNNFVSDEFATIKWRANSYANKAEIFFYYTKNDNYQLDEGKLINPIPIIASGDFQEYTWNTSDIPKGRYYIYAKIDDGVTPLIYEHCQGSVLIQHLNNAILTVRPTVQNVYRTEGTLEFIVNNTGQNHLLWSAKSNNQWITIVEGENGYDDGKIMVSYENNDGVPRTGTITVSSLESQNSPQTLSIIQDDREVKVTADTPKNGFEFGHSVSIYDDYAIVGDMENTSGPGEVHIFQRQGLDWISISKLQALNETNGSKFGCSVDIDDLYAIVGSPDYNNRKGIVYIFKRQNNEWFEDNKIELEESNQEGFGYSLSLYGNRLLIGTDNSIYAYIYRREGTAWIQEAKLTTNNPSASNKFGKSVSLDKNYAIIGDYEGRGAVHIFKYNGIEWGQKKSLTSNEATHNEQFGFCVSVDNGTPKSEHVGITTDIVIKVSDKMGEVASLKPFNLEVVHLLIYGDINGNKLIELYDLIVGFKILTSSDNNESIYKNHQYTKVDLKDLIYIIQKISDCKL